MKFELKLWGQNKLNEKTENQKQVTVENTPMNPKWFIRMYWTNFWQASAHVKQSIFGKLLTKICTLLLVPFESKLVNFSTHCQCLKNLNILYIAFEANSHFRESSRTRRGSYILQISTQNVPKEVLSNGLQIFIECFSKIFGLTLTVGRQRSFNTVCVSKTRKIYKGSSCLFARFLSKNDFLKLEVHILLSILSLKKFMKNKLFSQ